MFRQESLACKRNEHGKRLSFQTTCLIGQIPPGASVEGIPSSVPTIAMDDPSQHCVDQPNSQEHVQEVAPMTCHPSSSSQGPTTQEAALESLASDLRKNVNEEVTHACMPNASSSASSSTRVETVHVIEGAAEKL